MREEIHHIPLEEINRQRQFAGQMRALDSRPQSYHIVTYGCQMNAHDSEKLEGMLSEMGLFRAQKREDADLVLFNTCCIRENAERKALGNIVWLKEVKKERPDMLVGVCGCMMQQAGMAEKVLKQYPFVDLAFGTGNIYRLPELLLKVVDKKEREICVGTEESTLFEGLPVKRDDAYKAYITIMYGCNNFCSFCIVPYVRGRERSRKAKDILNEALRLRDEGVQEIMLLGQNVNSYGLDSDDMSFPKLLRELDQIGIPRIRFMTSHPKDLSDDLIDVLANGKNICPHLHLPVQSGSNRILKMMNRRYTVEHYLERAESLRAARPDIGLTTDLIVAFPGETPEDFNLTLDLVKRVRYDSAFTFIYSPRIGTVAAKMPDQISAEIAGERIDRLLALQERITRENLASMVGRVQQVLCEGISRRNDNEITGKTGRGISVNFSGDAGLIGKIVPVTITDTGSNTLRGMIKE